MANILVIQLQGNLMMSALPLVIVLIPIVGSILVGLLGLKDVRLSRSAAVIISAFTVYLTAELFSCGFEWLYFIL
jgi:hypothetical protein